MARKANRPNAIEEQEAYKEARRMLRIAIRKCKTESWKNLIETINSDLWGKDQAWQKTEKVCGKLWKYYSQGESLGLASLCLNQ